MQLTRRHAALPLARAATLALLAPLQLRADTLQAIAVTATYRERMALPAGSTLDLFDEHGTRIARFAPGTEK